MREKTVCRFCESHSQSAKKALSGERRPFAISGATPHYAPDRPFKLTHLKLDLEVIPKKATVKGWAIQTITTVLPDQKWLKLDQIGLQIEEVKVGDRSTEFYVQGQTLNIELPAVPAPGEELQVSVKYRAEQPRRGIYFTGPDAAYPKKPYQVWTQGQDEDSRYWFPSFDFPNQKATTEVIATVPRGFTAISNGALISKNDQGELTRYHYRLGIPHVTYLVTLVIAELVEISEKGPRGLPIQYFVSPGREEDGRRAFANTPRMIEAFEAKTGVHYPYEKYSQVAVQDFIFGGMENTSATTQTDLTLHDARAHLDFSSDPLVAHELAHQWFGDLLTCRDWSHGWLNEGFATFMERVWIECDTSPNGGFEEAKYYSYQDLSEYLHDDLGKYRRPIVCNTYIEPIDLFDTHLYQKGGLVLNLIRNVLGESLFWKSVQLYLTRHRGQNVETLDLIRAIEETTGRNLRRLFDEWVFNAGYPEFEINYQWHEDKKLAEWVIEQKQTGGQASVTKDGATTHLFHLPIVLEMTLDGGQKITHRIELGEARERVFLHAPSKPLRVRFDPDFWIPKTLKFPRPKEMLLNQLKHDSDCMGRIEAAQELSKMMDPDVVKELGKALLADSFWGAQAEIAKVLGEFRSEFSRDALIQGLKIQNPKARRAVVTALGSFKDDVSATALRKLADKDPSYFVESSAVTSWAQTKIKPIEQTPAPISDEVQKFLVSKLSVESYRDVICASALKGLAELPGIQRGDHPQALQSLMDWTARGRPLDARGAAVRALGQILQKATRPIQLRILEVLSFLADEDNFRLRMQLVATLEGTGLEDAIPILSKMRKTDLDGRVTRGAQAAMDRIMLSGGVPETISNLKTAMEKLEEEYKKLRSQVEEKNIRN